MPPPPHGTLWGGGRGGAESEGQNSPPPTSTRHALQLHRLMHDGPKKQKPFTAGAARAHTEKKRRGKEQHWARGRRVACAQQGGLCGPTTPRGAPKFHTRDDMKPLVAHTCSADADNVHTSSADARRGAAAGKGLGASAQRAHVGAAAARTGVSLRRLKNPCKPCTLEAPDGPRVA